MPSLLEDPEPFEERGQEAFNLAVWERVLADEFLGGLPHRIETDRFGRIVMSPFSSPDHGFLLARVAILLQRQLPVGVVITVCPLSTSEGVKAVDIGWISNARRQPQRAKLAFTEAPEICVEIASPADSQRELFSRKALCFEAGAEEVWLCRPTGDMTFFHRSAPEVAATHSAMCPNFPSRVEIDDD